MDTLTLELRQRESQVSNANGDFEVVIKNIVLEDQDSVVCKSVFIDTEASSNQKINIEEDITLNFEWVNWVNFYYAPSNKPGVTWINPNAVTNPITGAKSNTATPTNNTYVNSLIQNSPGTEEYGWFSELIVQQAVSNKNSIPFLLEMTYTNIAGEQETVKVSIPAITRPIVPTPIQLGNTVVYKVSDGITFNPTQQIIKSSFGAQIDFTATTNQNDHVLSAPIKYSTSISLDSGSYAPLDLCNAINSALTVQSNKAAPNELYGNNFLQPAPTGTNWLVIATGSDNTKGYPDAIKQDIDNSDTLLCGTSQFELTFLDTSQKFAFNQLHSAVLDDLGNEVISYDATNGIVQTAYSGIYITHLSSTGKTGDIFDFWSGKLGFNVDSIYPTVTPQVLPLMIWEGTYPVNFLETVFNVTPGKNFTEGLSSIASLVPTSKVAQGKVGGFYLPLIGTVENPTNGKNKIIEAAVSTLSSTSNFAYFLIEVATKIGGKYYTVDSMKNNVRAIVGRFYDRNSYTTGSEADSLVYTHHGSPVFIESFKCRILNSEKDLAPNIGSDNTIFLQIVKNNTQEK